MSKPQHKQQTGEGSRDRQRAAQTHPPYPGEFRAEAVALVRRTGLSVAHVARDLGVTAETWRLWVKPAASDAGRREGGSTDERDEVTRRRREHRILKEEREILVQAAACFAQERAIR